VFAADYRNHVAGPIRLVRAEKGRGYRGDRFFDASGHERSTGGEYRLWDAEKVEKMRILERTIQRAEAERRELINSCPRVTRETLNEAYAKTVKGERRHE
jgi:hypothetical protein